MMDDRNGYGRWHRDQRVSFPIGHRLVLDKDQVASGTNPGETLGGRVFPNPKVLAGWHRVDPGPDQNVGNLVAWLSASNEPPMCWMGDDLMIDIHDCDRPVWLVQRNGRTVIEWPHCACPPMPSPMLTLYGDLFHFDIIDQVHRDQGPAIELVDGAKIWLQGGLLHREQGPAILLPDGTSGWYRQGRRTAPPHGRLLMDNGFDLAN